MSKKSKKTFKVVGLILLGAVIVASLAVNVVLFRRYDNLKNNPASNEQQQAELERIVAKVGLLYKLPPDEKPDPFATVKDKELLKNQAFFKDAENGDYVLFYKNAKIAILYRESENRIINVGPLSDESTAQKISTHVFGTAEQAKSVKEKLKSYSQLSYDTETAPTGTYAKVVVVSKDDKSKELAAEIAQTLGGSVGPLPPGETPANAEITIFATQ